MVATFKKVICLRFLVKLMVFQCMIIELICLQSIFLQLFNEQSSKILPMMHIFEGMFFDLKLTLDLSEIWVGCSIGAVIVYRLNGPGFKSGWELAINLLFLSM